MICQIMASIPIKLRTHSGQFRSEWVFSLTTIDLFLPMRYNKYNRLQEDYGMSDDFGSDFITIVDDDGQEFELEVIESMDYNGKTYMSFLPADMKEDDPDYGFILLRVVEDENGDDVFESIDDEDELQDVYERFMALLYDDEDEEGSDE